MNRKKYCYMLVGLPGSGKTTWRKNFVRIHSRGAFQVLSLDDIIVQEAERQRSTYRDIFHTHAENATKKLEEKAEIVFQKKQNVVWDMTNLTRKSRAKKLAMVPEEYVKICIVFIEPEAKEWNRRLAKQDKGISEDVLLNMKNTFEFPHFDEGFHEIRTMTM